MNYRSLLFRAIGFLCLGIGIATAFIPLFPTVLFFLLAAFFLSRSSPEWHRWLRLHKQFGRTVRAWEDHGVLDWKIKVVTIACLISAMGVPMIIFSDFNLFAVIWEVVLIICSLIIISRPSNVGNK